MTGVTYDSGALIAGERGSSRLWALHRRVLERGQLPVLPTFVLGQVWRGGSQAQLSRLLRGCRVEPLDERRARSAGEALAASGRDDLIDATVVVTALARKDLIVTSDPDDLRGIASALGCTLSVYIV